MNRFSIATVVAAMRGDASASEREAELARVRVSESRFRQAIDTAHVLMWMTGPDMQFTYFNRHWLRLTGRSMQTERGSGWMEAIHDDDRRGFESTFRDAFEHRRTFRTEFRLRDANGKYRWLLDVGSAMLDDDGAFTGYVGSCLDITDNKIAELAVATISGRLIEAQEQERSRLARELHDDINQRLALLAIQLEQLRLNPPNARRELASRIDDLQQTALEISRDVQALSHELHSSKLDFLGLVPAFASFCREFSQQKKVSVHFTHTDIPHSVPRDISLCLFRVLQEASHNVVKHSGVERFDVELRGMADRACLTVRDTGRGFNPPDAVSTRGLGLVSMRERLNLVGGTLSIKSGPTRGTEIFAEVPLPGTGMMPSGARAQSHV
jgi:PAS domain S-box-containing protein